MPAPGIRALHMANAQLMQQTIPTTANVKQALLGSIAKNMVNIKRYNLLITGC